ncbi:SMC-Scp complex subunit ScpB [Pelagibacterium sp. H642]|uniref:SMC-Scp complex subunit ScpB n=1 Tax=Pelagibacterium sp. H642 TaxID=1881069 RepID=UPI00281516EE|nr:SMC-Scp complex subunit ScpB [Pelagibacterium sp. H642]WMT92527.1 SMC-Scp complex subunit ScpB [Pelagibacterium sp. H642]
MPRPSRKQAELLDVELEGLPPELRWREWMARVEAVIFAAPEPVTREFLARIVGKTCSIDLLIEDIANELASRPYEIVSVAGGWQFRTRLRHSQVLKAAFGVTSTAAHVTETEMLVLALIAYHQPVTRSGLAEIIGREVSRDVIGRLRELDFIAAGPRAPQPGAPYTYVTTNAFLSHFGFATLRDLPSLEALEDAGLLGGRVEGPAAMPIGGPGEPDDAEDQEIFEG